VIASLIPEIQRFVPNIVQDETDAMEIRFNLLDEMNYRCQKGRFHPQRSLFLLINPVVRLL
jgi:hypothetical protein